MPETCCALSAGKKARLQRKFPYRESNNAPESSTTPTVRPEKEEMTRFLYIADTHLGADPMGYQQQQGYPERLPELLKTMEEWISAEGDIDFLLHGGDMVDAATEENIQTAADLFRFSIPVYLCLGNHDLTHEKSLEMWLGLAPQFFKNQAPTYAVETDDCTLHVIPNHWEETPYFWGSRQDAQFSADQLSRLETDLAKHSEIAHIVSTHSPAIGLPTEQTGFPEPHHSPPESFQTQLMKLVAEHGQIQSILGAHNHMNMHLEIDSVNYVTTSSFSETPFNFKLFEITPTSISMSTPSLFDRMGFRGEYDFDKTFVQGREKDRSFTRAI
jgi:hypothetical protein